MYSFVCKMIKSMQFPLRKSSSIKILRVGYKLKQDAQISSGILGEVKISSTLFDRVGLGSIEFENQTQSNSHRNVLVRLCSIIELIKTNRSIKFD